jgi:SAM-dependent methyltransferase
MENNLTNRNYWIEYWKNYSYKPIPKKTFFDKCIPITSENNRTKTFIEIGGFPGLMSIYFYKKYHYKTSLLDFYIDKDIINKLEEINQIPKNSIKLIEYDFFLYKSNVKFDLVFSLGFIEHFNNTYDVIKRHVDIVANNGSLLIILPNFKGLNGWIQKKFDKDNYYAHNLDSMEIANLKKIIEKLQLKNTKIEYTAKPMLWLANNNTNNNFIRSGVRLLSFFLKLIPIKCKFLSPYIIISATK